MADKGNFSASKFSLAYNAAGAACSSDVFSGEVDTGGAQNGLLILVADLNAASDVRYFEIWTSNRSDFGSTGTQLAAVTSDGTAQIDITSDTYDRDMMAEGLLAGTISDLTVSSNTVTAINQDGMYVFRVKNCSRYLKAQYDAPGALTRLAMAFIGTDLPLAPWPGARTAY